jgi:riboflavin synthase alpha subunit
MMKGPARWRRGAPSGRLPNAQGKVDLAAMLRDLAQRGVNELHVEAGHKLNGSLVREGLVDVKTTGLDTPGPINMEKALRANDRLGGHLVSGHVDGLGQVTHFAQVGESWELRIMAPRDLGRYLAYKGSITVNGVSLTVNRIADSADGCEVSINLIPHTVENTALGTLKAGSRVNLEIDLIARYVERMAGTRSNCRAATRPGGAM